VDQQLTSIRQEGNGYAAAVELIQNRMLSAPRALGSYSAFVIDGVPAAAGYKLTVTGVRGHDQPILAAVCDDEKPSGPQPPAMVV
jgi:hypothetical protein